MLDLHKLHHFVVLAHTGSFIKAAEALHLSQPALSRSIQALERQYRVTLFDRSRTGAVLTPVGKQLLARAEDLLFNATALEQALEGAAAGVNGLVRFGIGPSAADLIVPRLLEVVLAKYPDIRVNVVIGSVASMMRQLLDTEIDFFIGLRTPHISERVGVEPLWVSGPAFLVRPEHPLLATTPVPLEALRSYPRIGPTAWNKTLAHTVPEEARSWLNATIELDNFELAAKTAATTDAILVASDIHEVAHLTPLPIDTATQPLRRAVVGLYRIQSRTMSPTTATVVHLIRHIAWERVGFAPVPGNEAGDLSLAAPPPAPETPGVSPGVPRAGA